MFLLSIYDSLKDSDKNLKVDIDYIAEEPALDPSSLQFRKVFDAFRAAQILSTQEAVQKGLGSNSKECLGKGSNRPGFTSIPY